LILVKSAPKPYQYLESTMTMKSLSICVLFVAATAPFAIAAGPPNIVFFFADDQTTSTLGCYGNSVVQTPNIDSLAAEGMRFDNAFVSHPICWVSRTTILTGLTGRSYGTPSNPDLARADAVETLYSDILRENGYRTGYFGKWHARMPKSFKKEEHFDEIEVIGRNPFYKKQPDGSLRHETEVIVDRGIDFIKRQPKGKPFALNMWFNACHAEDSDRRPGIGHFPWPRVTDGMYDDHEMAPPRLNDPATFEALPDFLKTSITRERYFWRWNTEDKYQTNMRAYYRMVSGIDGAIGRFMEALEEAGLAENTIIVYSADNGYHMANRGLAGKWSHYEESIRVPLIVRDPRVPAAQRGQVTDAMALNLDLPATFLDWAGVEVPARYQGHSLQTVVNEGRPEDWRTETFHEHFAVRSRIPAYEGLRNEDFKYVRYFDHGNHEFLHHLKGDPDELVNLAGDPKYADTLVAMRERTTKRVAELGGPFDAPKQPFTLSTPPHPEASAVVTLKPGDDGFVKLFNGKKLQGWTGESNLWSVKDGAITGTTDGTLKLNSFLSWKGSTIRNFDLRLQIKISAGGNSGIQYRSASRPEIGLHVVSGYQCDIVADKAEYNGMLYEERGRGILSQTGQTTIIGADGKPQVKESTPAPTFAPGEWHEYRILAQGNHLQHWIDGQPTTDVIDLDEAGRSMEGVLAFQVHVGAPMTVQFKDISIKHLPDGMDMVN
jgi:choline-sulfatase